MTPSPRSFSLGNTRRFPASRGAWAVLALFLLAGIAVLDDYGVAWDESVQRRHAEQNLDYILGDRDTLPTKKVYIFYGVAFELPLLLVERGLGLEDTRTIYLSRHLLIHLFFLLGGLCCYLLALRLFNNRILALAAMLLFLLHPRLYAHSFLNSKDIPFFSMFMIALLLIHRAFAHDTMRAFLLCGAAVAVLINLRVMGVMLFIAVVMMRGLDGLYATSREERKHILKTGGVFILSSVLVLYAIWPYLWEDPLGRLVEAFTIAFRFPFESIQLFKGEFVYNTDLPWEYLPTWFLITTPWVTLLLGLAGMIVVGHRGLTQPRKIVRNTPLRFQWLLLACFVLPILAVIVLKPTLSQGWRHMYFLYAPFCLLAVYGLHWLLSFYRQKSWRASIYALTGIGLAVVVIEMAQIHPYQNLYFNALVDRRTPGYLRAQYEVKYQGVFQREGLEYLLERYPDSPIHVYGKDGFIERNRMILPASDRQQIIADAAWPDFYIDDYRRDVWKGERPDIFNSIYTRKVYNNPIFAVYAVNLDFLDESNQAFYRNIYHKVKAEMPGIRSVFDVYVHDGKLVYVRKLCSAEDLRRRFFLHVLLVNETDLPDWRKPYGFDNRDFDFHEYGVRFDGKCMAVVPLPEYEISSIRTGQFTRKSVIWEGKFSLKQD